MSLEKRAGLKLSELPEPLDSRIRQLAQIRAQLAADELQVINLSDVITEFGNRWENVRSRVLTTALHFLKKRLADYDTLIPCSDGFIIIFGTRKGPEAATACRRLAEALSKFFLGDQAFGKCSAPCKYLTLGLKEIEAFMRTLDSTAALTPNESHNHTWDYRIRFRPVREVRRNFIVSYFTEPIDLRGRPLEQEEAASQNFATRRASAELDRAAIEAGTCALRKVINAGGRILIGFTVHIETLDDHAHCHLVLDALTQIEPELRRYAAIRITHVPPGFPRFHLDEHIHLRHQRDIRLALDLSLDDHNADILAHPFISSFGLHFGQRAAALFRDPSSHALAQLRARVHRIHEARKRIALIADGCADPLALAHEIDADYVSALNVWPFSEEPTSLHTAHEHQL
jgi:hypothetical protein